jgi:heme/copper-type cytochrome/quinol oxidase subunit 2
MKKSLIAGIFVLLVLVLVVFGISKIFDSSSATGNIVNEDASNAPVKEFVIQSFYDDKGIWFSLKEISVNKGDLVRIKITNIKGMHDFKIDEFGVYSETPLNQETVIEFVADKAGEFIYYCTKPGHREKGQWGTLKVLE